MSIVIRGSRFLFLAMGVCLLGYLLWRVGVRSVFEQVLLIGWGIVPVLIVSLSVKCSNTLAWRMAFPPEGSRPGYGRLLTVYLAADVVNLLPTANIGGELAKSYFLRAETPMTESASAVVANKTVEAITGIVFAAAGVGLALSSLPLVERLRSGLIVAVFVVGSAVGLAFLLQRRRPIGRLLGFLGRLRIRIGALERRREAVDSMDAHLSGFYTTNRRRFLLCTLLHFGSWIMGVLEAYLIIRFMGQEVAFTTVFLLVALAFVVKAAFFFVPASIGAFEAGQTYLFYLLGMTPALGLSVALIQRFRQVLWMGTGLALLYLQSGARPDPVDGSPP
ncbi:MAG: lysylphosphatidylglycerol synthase domain-containing protein [Candidatus Latescibacteria bacterium]|nr:lysylphosphatidylglycerol synthase domain-containing protein [Candidatus Latescibacterota bacterium]